MLPPTVAEVDLLKFLRWNIMTGTYFYRIIVPSKQAGQPGDPWFAANDGVAPFGSVHVEPFGGPARRLTLIPSYHQMTKGRHRCRTVPVRRYIVDTL
jgi:hypothetical protein